VIGAEVTTDKQPGQIEMRQVEMTLNH